MPFGGTRSIDDYDTGTQAAAAGGTTCIVDFALQMEPGGLRSLARASGRGAPRAPRTSTTASTWRSRRPTRARSPTCRRWSTQGVTTLQGLPRLHGRADGRPTTCSSRVLERSGDSAALDDGARRERLRDRPARQAGARRRRRPTRSTTPAPGPRMLEAEATGRAVRLAEFAGAPHLHRPRHLRARPPTRSSRARARGVPVYGETCIQYLFNTIDDLAPPGLRGRALRLLAAAARRRATRSSCGTRCSYDHLQASRPTTARSTTSRSALGLDDFSKIPNGLAVIQHRLVEAVGRTACAGGRHHAEPSSSS